MSSWALDALGSPPCCPDELTGEVETGAIDTVIVAFTDMQGRLMGKRLHGEYFVEEIGGRSPGRGLRLPARARHGDGADPGLRDRELGAGLRRFRAQADLDTLRRIPWLEATALVLCRRALARRLAVQPSPRQVLKAQVERAAALGSSR